MRHKSDPTLVSGYNLVQGFLDCWLRHKVDTYIFLKQICWSIISNTTETLKAFIRKMLPIQV